MIANNIFTMEYKENIAGDYITLFAKAFARVRKRAHYLKTKSTFLHEIVSRERRWRRKRINHVLFERMLNGNLLNKEYLKFSLLCYKLLNARTKASK